MRSFFFSSRRRHTRWPRDWSSDVCSSDLNPVTRQLVRFIINVNRAVPDLVFAMVLVAMVGVGVLPGLITLFLFDLGVVVKLVSEAIEGADHDYIEAGQAAGGTQSQINKVTLLPQSWTLYANQWLYSLELNVRISAILGIVGAGGIGRLLDERRGFYAYDDVSVIILEILVVVMIIELCSNLFRSRLRGPRRRCRSPPCRPGPPGCGRRSPPCWSGPWCWSRSSAWTSRGRSCPTYPAGWSTTWA